MANNQTQRNTSGVTTGCLKSIVQKAIRRGRTNIAIGAAVEMIRRKDVEPLLKRLPVICCEECVGTIDSINILNEVVGTCKSIRVLAKAGKTEDVMQLAIRIVRLLADSEKDKTACWTECLAKDRYPNGILEWKSSLIRSVEIDKDPIKATAAAFTGLRSDYKVVFETLEPLAVARGHTALELVENIRWRVAQSARGIDVEIMLAGLIHLLMLLKPEKFQIHPWDRKVPVWAIDMHCTTGRISTATCAKQLASTFESDLDNRKVGEMAFFMSGIALNPPDKSPYRKEAEKVLAKQYFPQGLESACSQWLNIVGPKLMDLNAWIIKKRGHIPIDENLPLACALAGGESKKQQRDEKRWFQIFKRDNSSKMALPPFRDGDRQKLLREKKDEANPGEGGDLCTNIDESGTKSRNTGRYTP